MEHTFVEELVAGQLSARIEELEAEIERLRAEVELWRGAFNRLAARRG
jgi:uncharacterized small protein (DUF1192 family)